MSRKLIVVGDPTTGGGTVITGTPFTDIDGNPVARVGDKATCAKCKGIFPIVTGDSTFLIDGQPVAREHDAIACGCKLMSARQFRVFLDECIGDQRAAAAAGISTGHAALAPAPASDDPGGEIFDEAFVLKSELTGGPLIKRGYRVIREDGTFEEGVTDQYGRTHVIESSRCEQLKIEIAEEGAA